MDETLKVALETIEMGKQAIVFVPSKASAEKTAEDLSLLLLGNGIELHDLEANVLKAVTSPTRQCKRLAKVVKKGVAFHHAGLANKQRELIEDEFRAGRVKIICATPTLAAGLSMPAFRVILKSLKRFSGKWGMDWIPVLEYFQMA
ncbi:MAG: helicase-related protein, partial [Candidatus Heimdallarchaeota archaeon]